MSSIKFDIFTIASFAIREPYNIHDKAFSHVVTLVKNGNEAVERSLSTVFNVARGEPINITAKLHPRYPRALEFPIINNEPDMSRRATERK